MKYRNTFKSYKDIAAGTMTCSKRINDCNKLKEIATSTSELEMDHYSFKDLYFQPTFSCSKSLSKIEEWFL